MGLGMTTVFMGPAGEALAVCAMLQARGIPAYIPDDFARTLVPFELGGLLMLDRAVQVPDRAAGQALAFVAEHTDDQGAEPEEDGLHAGEEELPTEYFEDQPAATRAQEAAAAALGRRICWAALLPIGLPFVLYQIGPYLRAVERLGRKPALHRTTIAAAILSPFWCAASWLPAYYHLLVNSP